MKFKPEALIQIYLDGSLTEEAREVFDALLQEDMVFAERVTNAVAQRFGQPPETILSEVEGRLDAKAEDLWLRNKPSAAAWWGKTLWKFFLTAALGAGIYIGWLLFGAVLKEIWARQDSDNSSAASTLRLNPKAAPALGPVSQEGDEEQFIPVEKHEDAGKESTDLSAGNTVGKSVAPAGPEKSRGMKEP